MKLKNKFTEENTDKKEKENAGEVNENEEELVARKTRKNWKVQYRGEFNRLFKYIFSSML